VRKPNLGSVFYAPNTPPTDAAEMQRFLFDELKKISDAINGLALGHLDQTTVVPLKARDGDLRYADGILWNPGSGKGVYVYKSTAWVLLG
jgi:hypothetical protein